MHVCVFYKGCAYSPVAERSVTVEPLHGIRLRESLGINDLTMKIKSHMTPYYIILILSL